MNKEILINAHEPPRAAWWMSAACLVPACLFLAAGFCVYSVTGYFRLGPDAAAMRRSVMGSIGGSWDKTIAVNVGGFTVGLVRLGSRFFPMDAEPRAAFESLRNAEVGIYKFRSEPQCADRASILATLDRAMAGRGWHRVVGVCKDQDLVSVYVPRKRLSPRRTRACIMVLHEGQLIIASACGNLDPLMVLAAKHIDLERVRRQAAEL